MKLCKTSLRYQYFVKLDETLWNLIKVNEILRNATKLSEAEWSFGKLDDAWVKRFEISSV